MTLGLHEDTPSFGGTSVGQAMRGLGAASWGLPRATLGMCGEGIQDSSLDESGAGPAGS